MPVSSHLTVAIDSKSQLTNASGSVHFDPGYLRFDDPNDEPRLIEFNRYGLSLGWRGPAGSLSTMRRYGPAKRILPAWRHHAAGARG